jgi:tetratricopeptide (TPR) repeat protein
MKKSFYLLQLCLCVVTNCIAQNSLTDSLLNLLRIDKNDTTKLIHLYQLSDEFENLNNFNEVLKYGNQAIELSTSLINSSTTKLSKVKQTALILKAKTYSNIGLIYYKQGNYYEALKNHTSSMEVLKTNTFKDSKTLVQKGISTAFNNIGNVYKALGNYPTALENYFSSKKIKEQMLLPDGQFIDKRGLGNSYNNIGIIYYEQHNYTEALKNHLSALKIRSSISDKKSVADSYNNIAVIYLDNGNYSEALKNLFASLKIRKEIDDQNGIASSYTNIGIIYKKQGNYEDALKNHFASLSIKEAIGNKEGIVISYTNIGDVFREQKKYDISKKWMLKAIVLSKIIGGKYNLKFAYHFMTKLDSATGNFKGAYENHKLYILYRDSLDNEDTRKKTIQTQMNYDFEKKEAIADAVHKKELRNQAAFAEVKRKKQNTVLFLVVG